MTILVVDDEALLVKGIRFNLKSDGYDVITGSNGQEAVELTKSENPDLVVLDVMMPVMDATTVIVAQRISTILGADQIIVLDDGHMAGIGTHKELMANCEVYQQIARSQLSEEELA